MCQLSSTDSNQNYAAGQLWQYRARPGEEDSRVLINRVDPDVMHGQIFHISVLDVNIVNPQTPEGLTTELPHFPVSEESLHKSLTRLVATEESNPDYMEGYNIWKEAFDAGKAGVFSIDVAEIVNIIEASVNRQD